MQPDDGTQKAHGVEDDFHHLDLLTACDVGQRPELRVLIYELHVPLAWVRDFTKS
jgi:hypothetical protein